MMFPKEERVLWKPAQRPLHSPSAICPGRAPHGWEGAGLEEFQCFSLEALLQEREGFAYS